MANKKTEHRRRQEFRKKLLSWGMSPEDVELCVENMKERQRLKKLKKIQHDAPICTMAVYARYLRQRNSSNGASIFRLGEDYEPPSDTGYKPTAQDPLLNGVARATGTAAKVVKRRKTVTKYQYDKENGDGKRSNMA